MTPSRPSATALVVGLLLLAGCLGGPQVGSSAPSTPSPTGAVLVVTRADASAVEAAPASARDDVANLTADRRDEFLAALETDVREPAQWEAGSEIEYVRHDGTWYRVQVVIEN